jgi:hypothetical protein
MTVMIQPISPWAGDGTWCTSNGGIACAAAPTMGGAGAPGAPSPTLP